MKLQRLLRLKDTVFYIILSLILSISLPSYATDNHSARKPIIITSETLTINKKENQAFFKGSVIAKKDDITIFSDTMLVNYDETGTKVKAIEASGNVKVLKGTRTILSERAVYIAEEDSITFTGEPVAMDGKNMIKGDKIIYYISEDRSVISNSKVFLKNESTNKNVSGEKSD
ncbi:MAG: LptA/OstA family protein [Thermodesulfovibrionales bacterium]